MRRLNDGVDETWHRRFFCNCVDVDSLLAQRVRRERAYRYPARFLSAVAEHLRQRARRCGTRNCRKIDLARLQRRKDLRICRRNVDVAVSDRFAHSCAERGKTFRKRLPTSTCAKRDKRAAEQIAVPLDKRVGKPVGVKLFRDNRSFQTVFVQDVCRC